MFPTSADAQARRHTGAQLLSSQLAVSLSEQQQRQYSLVEALQDPARYAHPTRDIRVIETHISIVILTGAFAYKIKKPVNLGFLDFSTLQRRKYFCEEEVRLNSRYAPEIYLGVVSFSGSPGAPFIRDKGEGFEYAVRMVQFDQGDLFSAMLDGGDLGISHIRQLAGKLADFHLRVAAPCDATSPYGSKAQVLAPMLENFSQIREIVTEARMADELAGMEKWTRRAGIDAAERMEKRRATGFVRECHGDLHLDNIAWISGRAVLFDGIEFNPHLRFIDTMSEVAFPVMDLLRHGAHGFANVLLNDYLEITDDYDGLDLFRLYLVYRALVRAKIIAIRSRQAAPSATLPAEFRACVELAKQNTKPSEPGLYITHGLSGTGKSFVADRLVRDYGLLRLRSDHTRKRLHGLASTASTSSAVNEGIYAPQATDATYSRLAENAQKCLRAGFSPVVDATFLHFAHRDMFRQLAARAGVAFTILDIHAPDSEIQQRLEQRRSDNRTVSEADHAVFSAQLGHQDTLSDDELKFTKRVHNVQGQEPALDTVFS